MWKRWLFVMFLEMAFGNAWGQAGVLRAGKLTQTNEQGSTHAPISYAPTSYAYDGYAPWPGCQINVNLGWGNYYPTWHGSNSSQGGVVTPLDRYGFINHGNNTYMPWNNQSQWNNQSPKHWSKQSVNPNKVVPGTDTGLASRSRFDNSEVLRAGGGSDWRSAKHGAYAGSSVPQQEGDVVLSSASVNHSNMQAGTQGVLSSRDAAVSRGRSSTGKNERSATR